MLLLLLLLLVYMGYGSEFESLALTSVKQNVFRSAFFVVSYQQALCGFTALLCLFVLGAPLQQPPHISKTHNLARF